MLTPDGDDPLRQHFGGATLQRARAAVRLTRDLELSAAGVALVLELLDQIEALRSLLRRSGLA